MNDRERDEWREAKRDIDRVGWFTGTRILIIVLAVLLLGAGIWGFNVLTSGVKGQGDGEIIKNSAENWIDAQERFEENYADYESTLFKIQQASDALAVDPSNRTLQQNLTGTVNYCASLVADYNADARNFLREDFRAADLPDELDVDNCTAPTLQ